MRFAKIGEREITEIVRYFVQVDRFMLHAFACRMISKTCLGGFFRFNSGIKSKRRCKRELLSCWKSQAADELRDLVRTFVPWCLWPQVHCQPGCPT